MFQQTGVTVIVFRHHQNSSVGTLPQVGERLILHLLAPVIQPHRDFADVDKLPFTPSAFLCFLKNKMRRVFTTTSLPRSPSNYRNKKRFRHVTSGSYLSVAADDVFVARQFLERHWPSRMKSVGAYSDLCAKAKLAAISKARRRIPINCRRINLAKKLLCRSRVACHNTITVVRTKSLDVLGRVHRVTVTA